MHLYWHSVVGGLLDYGYVRACHRAALTFYGRGVSGHPPGKFPEQIYPACAGSRAGLHRSAGRSRHAVLCPDLLAHPADQLLFQQPARLCAVTAKHLLYRTRLATQAGRSTGLNQQGDLDYFRSSSVLSSISCKQPGKYCADCDGCDRQCAACNGAELLPDAGWEARA